MKSLRRLFLIILLPCISGLTGNAIAALIVQEPVPGEFVVVDTDTNLMWLKNADLAGGMTWADARDWADTLFYGGYNDWRLPYTSFYCSDYDCTDSELGYLFYESLENVAWFPGCTPGVDCGLISTGPFENLQNWWYWSNTEWHPEKYNGVHWSFSFDDGRQFPWKSGELHVLAVRNLHKPVSLTPFMNDGGRLSGKICYKKEKE